MTSNANEPTFAEQLLALGELSRPLQQVGLKMLSGLELADLRTFRELWPHIPGERRVVIVEALDELAEGNIEFDFRAVFLTCLEDSESAVRVAAIDGLWEDDRPATMDRLIELLADPVGDVRAAAAIGLARYAHHAELGELPVTAGERLQQTLLHTTTDPEQPLEVRRRAIEALGYFAGSAEAQAEVGQAYAHPEQLMRESAIVAMGRSMRPTWFPYIERELSSISPAMRYEAARAVGELGEVGQPLLTALMPLVEEEDLEIALAAIWALGQVGGPHAKRVLQRIARSKNPARKQAADEALEELSISEL